MLEITKKNYKQVQSIIKRIELVFLLQQYITYKDTAIDEFPKNQPLKEKPTILKKESSEELKTDDSFDSSDSFVSEDISPTCPAKPETLFERLKKQSLKIDEEKKDEMLYLTMQIQIHE